MRRRPPVADRRRKRRLRRLLGVGAATSLVASAGLGHAAIRQETVEQPTIAVVAVDRAGRQTDLSRAPGWNVHPAVARDGRIAFFSDRDGPGLYVMDGGGGNVRRLSGAVALAEDLAWSQASWSPAGDRIAFDGTYLAKGPPCTQHCEGWNVLTIGVDGGGLEQLALGARAPAWSPDGKSIAYESGYDAYDESARSVTIVRVDGSRSVTLKAFNPEGDVGPVWSQRGGRLAFQARPAGRSAAWISIVRADGTGRRLLARGHRPAWSPDGRRLALLADSRLVAIAADGTHRRVLSRPGEIVVGAAWSPKGETLVYVAGTRRAPGGAANLRIETVNADGGHPHVLARETPASLIWGGPVWTADGRRVLVALEAH